MDILKGLRIEDIVTNTEEIKEYKTIPTTSLVTVISYLIGVNINTIEDHFSEYNQHIIEELKRDVDATTIRYLCRLRTNLFKNFKKTDNEMMNNLANLDRLEWFDKDEITWLEKEANLEIIKVNYRSEYYIEDFNNLIAQNIDRIKKLFPEWINWSYLRDLFVIPKSTKKHKRTKEEFNKFMNNITLYPFQKYIHWNPQEFGNILYCDGKFLQILYELHGEEFKDASKYRDASDGTKKSIYEFINQKNAVTLVVDCENSDAFKLYSALKSLGEEETTKIKKIVLYDDVNTTDAWDYLDKLVKIPVEHIEVDRVTERKSLVDVRMTAGICKAYYSDNIDGFILCSSDSDFWGVISALPDADFLVMFEYSKCGKDIKDALSLRSIYHCSLDDFYSGDSGKLKKFVLRKSIEAEIEDDIIGKNGYEIAKRIYEKNHIEAKESEIQQFYERYIKTLRLKLDQNGCFYIDIAE